MDLLMHLSRGAPVAAVLLALIVGASLWAFRSSAWMERQLLRPWQLSRGQGWHTLVTSGFVHADLAHLLFNAFTLWAFGFGLERALGSRDFAVLYAIGLLVSSGATWVLHRRNPSYASLGASGAILAVLFASIVVFPDSSIFILPIPVPIPAPLFALAYLAFSVVAGRGRFGRINHDAHVAGAVSGLLFMAWHTPGSIGRAWSSYFG